MKPAFAIPLDTAPMEAKAQDALPGDVGQWQYERKWDGFRCLAFKAENVVELRAKSGKPLGRYFPEIVSMLRELAAKEFVVDGEIVIEIEALFSFDALQMRLHPAASRIQKLSIATPAKLILFDMLANSEASLINQPFAARRAALESFVEAADLDDLELSRSTQDLTIAMKWLSESGQGSTDGVIAKLLADEYRPGERAMIKVKRLRTADCVVGGFRYLEKTREVGSLLLGLYNDQGQLDHVGFTSTIARDDRPELTQKLEALRASPGFTGKAPGAPSRWSTERSGQWEPLRPELVAEVRFDHVTGDRFRHGTKFMRWRLDKKPEQCTFEQITEQ
ncbi:ATP-dependent DNA ligase [Mesorhizobium sp. AR10]|uniref:ATP-dependent DNA ligase n=1 Tax=Mesorhizobium sp. AR10 TaxID=2865839 RepID=UPI0021603904|nr:ATP-dependent DNA ligase [Mesorhizobium sp. AR10]UVK38648.1 ATP-dependent DNA ligase [Mesorhizobium sp. AR10]